MQVSKVLGLRLIGLAALASSVGCVPLNDYRALEKRFNEQETYIVANKDKIREGERRQGVLTMRAREQERQLELTRARLQKSEIIRRRLQTRMRSMKTLPASTPRPVDPTPPKVMGLEVNPNTQGLVLENGVLFASGQAAIKASGQRVLKRVIHELNTGKYRDRHIRIEGHTDSNPIRRTRHTNKSNWDLSAKRALAVLHFLEKHGISSKRLSFSGYGPYQPLDQGKSKRSLARNRRVEIVLFE